MISRPCYICIIGIAFLLTAQTGAIAADPRYLIFNRAPWIQGEDWWDQNHPESINATKLRQVADGIGAPPNPHLLLGVSFVFSILDTATPTLQQDLRNLTAASLETSVPVMVLLDGTAWWGQRPDLWNWWDPARPGYNPANVDNVEWSGWTSADAVKIGWRNWGHQFRVSPCPNLMSPALLAETKRRLDDLVPILVDWEKSLPAEKKHLFAGLKIGWEVGVGYNHWYYPNGNSYLEQWPADPSHDPQTGLKVDQGWPCGVAKIGYAAVKTAGIKSSGDLTVADIAEVIRRYLATLCEHVHLLGIPRDRLYAHMGGNYPPWDKHFSFAPAVNEWSWPSYSFYGHYPETAGDLGQVLSRADQPRWGVAEWYHGASTAQGWQSNMEKQLNYRDCRFLNIYNWEQFKPRPEAVVAARQLLSTWVPPDLAYPWLLAH